MSRKAIRRFETVTMMVCEEGLAGARAHCGEEIDYFVLPLDDSWSRDSGPVFVKRGDELAASIFLFNAWGGKYERYNNDAAVGHRVAEALGIPTFSANAFLEGGAIAVDGEGTIITAEQCMLNANRNPGMSKAEAERILCDALGGEKVIWVPGDPEDTETDGHIDALACFVKPGVVLCAVGADELPERRKNLHENWEGPGERDGRPGQEPRGDSARRSLRCDVHERHLLQFVHELLHRQRRHRISELRDRHGPERAGHRPQAVPRPNPRGCRRYRHCPRWRWHPLHNAAAAAIARRIATPYQRKNDCVVRPRRS